MAFDTKKFLVRTGSAVVFVAVLLGCILWGFGSFFALFLVISGAGLWEFFRLMEKLGLRPNKYLGILAGLLLPAWSFFYLNTRCENEISFALLLTLYLIVFFIFIAELFRNSSSPFQNIAATIAGIFYVSFPFTLFNLISCSGFDFCASEYPAYSFPAYQYKIILGIFLLIWSNDTFAYLVGSFLGKNKLFERISPGKTREGSIGGGLLTIGASFLIYNWFGLLSFTDWAVIAAIVVVFGTLGDLVESMLKRSAGVKDSGNIMPGHGGVLDRFDSLLLATPFIFVYLHLVGY